MKKDGETPQKASAWIWNNIEVAFLHTLFLLLGRVGGIVLHPHTSIKSFLHLPANRILEAVQENPHHQQQQQDGDKRNSNPVVPGNPSPILKHSTWTAVGDAVCLAWYLRNTISLIVDDLWAATDKKTPVALHHHLTTFPLVICQHVFSAVGPPIIAVGCLELWDTVTCLSSILGDGAGKILCTATGEISKGDGPQANHKQHLPWRDHMNLLVLVPDQG